jgi:putative nucleotidyltransferase with HDIG domain
MHGRGRLHAPEATPVVVFGWQGIALRSRSGVVAGVQSRHTARMTTATDIDRDRDAAWKLLTTYTTSESLLGHARAVEAAVRWYARSSGEDEALWGVTALLHDFDYEMHPTLDEHPMLGAPILREAGYSETVIRAIQSHASHTGVSRESQLERTLYACDELSGFVVAVARVRPAGFDGLTPKSVTKKLKTPSFAAGVHRDEVRDGAEQLGIELSAHIANVIEALAPIGSELLGVRTQE